MPFSRALLALVVALLVSGCSDDEPPSPPKPEYAPGTVIGQEVWIPYVHASHEARGIETRGLQDADGAKAQAEELRRSVIGGKDIGEVAFTASRAPGAFVGGYSGLLPRATDARDPRDRAMLAAKPGQLTEVIEWEHGFWFGVPVSAAKGEGLRRRFEDARRIKARARLIHLHYAGATPRRHEFDGFPKASAVEAAEALIAELRGGAAFSELARRRSNDEETRARGGTLMQPPLTPDGMPTEWIQWRAWKRHYPYPLLEAVLETAPVGRVRPKPLVTEYGVMVLEVLERDDGR